MSETDAEAAIVAHLVTEPGVALATNTGPSGVTSSIVGGGLGADPATVVVQRTRELPTCQMHSVAFTNQQGLAVEWVIRTTQNPDGSWVVAPVGGGSVGGAPRSNKPWVNFAAGFGPDGFTAGGRVEDTGSEDAVQVRLVFKDSFTMDDRVENGIVLFFEARRVRFPADAEILDRQGGLLARDKEFDLFVT
jgi:hypothetical protein